MKYEFSFSVRGLTEEEIQRLIDRISELVPTESLSAEVRGGRLRIVINGPPRSADAIRLSLRKALSEMLPPRNYRTRLSVRDAIGPGPAPPLEVIVEALKMTGYDSQAEGDYIATQAPIGQAEKVARGVAALWREVSGLGRLSGAAKKALTLAAFVTSRPVAELLESGLSAGVLIKQENNKIQTAFDWRTAAERLRRMVPVGGGA